MISLSKLKEIYAHHWIHFLCFVLLLSLILIIANSFLGLCIISNYTAKSVCIFPRQTFCPAGLSSCVYKATDGEAAVVCIGLYTPSSTRLNAPILRTFLSFNY